MSNSQAPSRRFFLAAFSSLALVLLAAADQVAADPPPAELALCIGGAPGLPLLLAEEQGLFIANRVPIKLKKYRTASEGFEGFFQGACDLVAISETSLVLKSFARQDFKIVATLATSDNSPRIVANRERGITTPLHLKSKRIFVLKGSSNHYFLDLFLEKNGLAARETTLLFAGIPDIAAALVEGQIDAFCATEILIDKPLKALGEKAVVFDAPGLCRISFLLVAKNEVIRDKAKQITALLAALLASEERNHEDPAAAIATAAAELKIDEPVMRRIWANYRWRIDLSQVMLLSLEHEAMWAMAAGLTTQTHLPNYLDFIHRESLFALKPEAVTLLP